MMKKCIVLLMLWLSAILVLPLASCSSSVSEDTETTIDEEDVIPEVVIEEDVSEETKELKPAKFKVESLVISPGEVVPYEKCLVTVGVSNIGEIEGTYEVNLCLDNEVKEIKQVTLDGGVSETLSFTLSESQPGTYTIDLNGLTGVLTIKQYTPPPEPEGDKLVRFMGPGNFQPGNLVAIPIDFDSDEDLDLIVPQFYWPPDASKVIAFRNDGKGNLTEATEEVFNGVDVWTTHSSGWAVADFNGDGHEDVFISDSGADQHPYPGAHNVLLIQNEEGQLIDESSIRLPQLTDYTHFTTAGDIDGDRDIDIYVCNCGKNVGPYFLINDGSGVFIKSSSGLPSNVANMVVKYTSSLLVDTDIDGDLDLVLGAMQNTGKVQDTLLLNDGTGHFSFAPDNLPPRLYGSNALTVRINSADMDKDGWPDLLMAVNSNYTFPIGLQLLLNNGDGTFRDETPRINQDWTNWEIQQQDFKWVIWPFIIDSNGDGWQDILAIGGGVEHVLFESKNGDRFEVLMNLSQEYTSMLFNVSPGDFDNDGDIDFVLLYYNTSNQQLLLRK